MILWLFLSGLVSLVCVGDLSCNLFCLFAVWWIILCLVLFLALSLFSLICSVFVVIICFDFFLWCRLPLLSYVWCKSQCCAPRLQSSWGQHGGHLGPVGPRWAPCWPHEPCYQGCSEDIVITPASTKLKGGILVSPCPSVRPSVDRNMPALYLQQHSPDPCRIYIVHIIKQLQCVACKGVFFVWLFCFVLFCFSKFKNFKFW